MNREQKHEWARWALTVIVPLLISFGAAWYAQGMAISAINSKLTALKDSVDAYNRAQDQRITDVKEDARADREHMHQEIAELRSKRER